MFPGLNISADEWAKAIEAARKVKEKQSAAKKPGATCKHCAEFNEYAVADENGQHECWRCLHGPVR